MGDFLILDERIFASKSGWLLRINSFYLKTSEILYYSVVVCHLTYLFLTPWSRVLLEKLTGSQLVKKFPVFYGARSFITAFTSASHLSLS